MLPEYKYNQFARVKCLKNLILRKLRIKQDGIDLLGNRTKIFIQLMVAIEDAMKFYSITKDEFFENISNWSSTEKEFFEKSSNLKEFYESWNDAAAIENICANIFNQMIWFENYNVCAAYAPKSDFIIDYGCGTGSLSFGLALDKKIKNKLVLLDVPNDISKFREYRINKHHLVNVEQENIFNYRVEAKADLIICLDVLEHLENSSSVFENEMSPMLKVGGLMILKAPWRGQMTHIDEAADDFYLNNGRKFLSKNFKEVYRFGCQDISCVYQKIK
jgi:2-polyprenyl-3-methyl-5-hydroxy-6-metoxy-1,4-benzoquinol methylase